MTRDGILYAFERNLQVLLSFECERMQILMVLAGCMDHDLQNGVNKVHVVEQGEGSKQKCVDQNRAFLCQL